MQAKTGFQTFETTAGFRQAAPLKRNLGALAPKRRQTTSAVSPRYQPSYRPAMLAAAPSGKRLGQTLNPDKLPMSVALAAAGVTGLLLSRSVSSPWDVPVLLSGAALVVGGSIAAFSPPTPPPEKVEEAEKLACMVAAEADPEAVAAALKAAAAATVAAGAAVSRRLNNTLEAYEESAGETMAMQAVAEIAAAQRAGQQWINATQREWYVPCVEVATALDPAGAAEVDEVFDQVVRRVNRLIDLGVSAREANQATIDYFINDVWVDLKDLTAFMVRMLKTLRELIERLAKDILALAGVLASIPYAGLVLGVGILGGVWWFTRKK